MTSSSSLDRIGWAVLQKASDAGKSPTTAILSPLSISIAVGMLAGAADDAKKHGLCLKFGLKDAQELESVLGATYKALSGGGGSDAPVTIANGVFTDPSVTLYESYQQYLKGFDVQTTQYPSLPEAADAINQWISDNTRGLIRNMLSPGVLRNSHLALINAIAFKGTWKKQFNKKNTQKWDFTTAEKSKIKVEMMFLNKERIMSLQAKNYTAVKLPYDLPTSYPRTSLIAYLPNEGTALSAVLEELGTQDSFTASRFKEVKYDKFGFPKIEIKKSFSLLDTLVELGYPVGGSYSEMGTGENQVQAILHQAFVKIDEEGTEAAAATAVLMTRAMPIDPPKILIFDRSFAFVIVTEQPDVCLFAGVFTGS